MTVVFGVALPAAILLLLGAIPGVQLLINVVTAAAGTLLLLAVASGLFGVPLPKHPVGFAPAFPLGTSAVFSLGLVIAAVAPRARVATAIGTVLFMLTQFFGGVYLPKFLLPDALVSIGEFVPPGVGTFSDAWIGDGPSPLHLGVTALIAPAGTAVAARFFRWE